MRSAKMLIVLVLGLMVSLAMIGKAAPMGTAWTYQGRLMDANDAAEGEYDFEFKLFDDPCTGAQRGSTIDVNDLDVIDGYFTAELDFGSDVFDGNSVWLEIDVRPGDSNDPNAFVALSPRQEVTPTPYALQTRGLFVDNAGNVGIGTTSPGRKLDVAGNINATDYYFLNDNVLVYSPKASGTFFYGWDVDVKKHSMSTDGVERLVINNLGNVGIGTKYPLQKLHVADAGMASLVVHETDNDVVGQLQADTEYVSLHSAFNHPLRFKINDITRMFIDTNGNVGIGTKSPNKKLTVQYGDFAVYPGPSEPSIITNGYNIKLGDPDGIGNQVFLEIDDPGNKFVFSNGNVGIGTESPTRDLHIYRDSGPAQIGIVTADNSSKAQVIFGDGGGNKWTISSDNTDDNNLHFRSGHASGTPRVTLQQDGKVGIGTTNPSEKLDVDGNIDVSNNRVKNYRGFPRPDYDSGWVSISSAPYIRTLNHNLGSAGYSDVDNYVVDMQIKSSTGTMGIHCFNYGGEGDAGGSWSGACYRDLGTNTISIQRLPQDIYCQYIRIRIWVYN